jgi:hypothetical protein
MTLSRRAHFKQADAARALRAAVAAGLTPSGYTIAADGSITVALGGGGSDEQANTFDLKLRHSR